MSPLRLNGSTSGYSQLDAPAVAGDQTFTLPGTGGTLDRLNRAGNILQVVSVTKTDTFSTSNTAYTDVTGLSVSITPISASNKILVFGQIDIGSTADVFVVAQIVRDSTAIAVADAAGSRRQSSIGRYLGTAATGGGSHSNLAFNHLDSPGTTSATTYKIQIGSNSAGTLVVNRGSTDTDNANNFRTASSITVMEVAA